MSNDKTVSRSIGGLWFIAFICAKLAGLAQFPAWSWWWLLLPIVPVVTELLKVVFA